MKVLLFHILKICLPIDQELSSKRDAVQLKTSVTTYIIEQRIIIVLIFVHSIHTVIYNVM